MREGEEECVCLIESWRKNMCEREIKCVCVKEGDSERERESERGDPFQLSSSIP